MDMIVSLSGRYVGKARLDPTLDGHEPRRTVSVSVTATSVCRVVSQMYVMWKSAIRHEGT